MIYDANIINFDTVPRRLREQAIRVVQYYNSYMESGQSWCLASCIADADGLRMSGIDVKLPVHILAAAAIEGFLV